MQKEAKIQGFDRVWFILIDHQKEGPYTLFDLKKDRRFTLDTLVWKEGFQEWIPARFIPELAALFADREKKEQELFLDQCVLVMERDPFQLFIVFLIFLLICFYISYLVKY